MINKLSMGLATYLKQVDAQNTPSIDVMKYSLYIILHNLFTIISITLVAIIFNEPMATLMGLMYFILLRIFAGGFHLHSSTWCTVLSILFVCIAPYIHFTQMWTLIITVVSVGIIAILAPRNFKGYARIPEKYYPFLKIAAVLIGGSNLFWKDSTLTSILVLQSILLLPKEKGGE
ncbi:accessory gene regulator ArgB-like protein [Cohnella lupini]|uniref:Accessory gene regulator protein AgrB n=1 Tax=Cohnella lupini TaxID=1294267 RepID=A0A3D9IQL4_9BACL|nr:accessory gene regulator B family protein [Cohnella lupini]RED63918.1 accessory gene regulator protein AgrB [Cohnella lupini]